MLRHIHGTVLLVGLGCAAFGPHGSAQVYYPVNGSAMDYTGPSIQGPSTNPAAKQHMNLFLPYGPTPQGGWPVLVHCDLGGFTQSSLLIEIDASGGVNKAGESGQFDGRVLFQCLQKGIAVATSTATTSTPDSISQGLVYRPGQMIPDPAQPGSQYEPYRSASHHFAEKDIVMMIQHVKYWAGKTGSVFSVVDDDRLAVYGFSSASMALMWAAFGPERKDGLYPPGAADQELESSRVSFAVLGGGTVWFRSHLSNSDGAHFPSQADPFAPADDLVDADPTCVDALSAVSYRSSATLPQTYMFAGVQFNSLDLSLPYLTNSEPPHSPWSSILWESLYPAETKLVLHKKITGLSPSIDYEVVKKSKTPSNIADWLAQNL